MQMNVYQLKRISGYYCRGYVFYQSKTQTASRQVIAIGYDHIPSIIMNIIWPVFISVHIHI